MKRFSLAFLKDVFLSVNNRVNGYEHALARRSKEFRPRRTQSKYMPHQGAAECARRRRQMAARS